MHALLPHIPGLLAAGDPLFKDGVDFAVVLIVAVKTLLTFVVFLVSVMLMVWFERKVHADMTNRIGPNRAGPWGILQTLADGIKAFFKEASIPANADRVVFKIAPYLALVPALLIFTIVPLSVGTVNVFGHQTRLQLADPPMGILFMLACTGIAVYGIMLAGWASGSKYPLLGSVRASAQMVSYEATLGLIIAMVVLHTGSLLTSDIVGVQAGRGFAGVLPNWNLLRLGFVPFILYIIAGTAEANRPPFDLVEAEQELVGGFHTEYAGIGFALYYLAEFGNTVTLSTVIVTLFLGGPAGPTFATTGWAAAGIGFVWFFLKTLCFLFLQAWFRATLPRLRYDQLMDLGWKKLTPLSLLWLLGLASIKATEGDALGHRVVVFAAFVAGALATWAALGRAVAVGRARTNDEVARSMGAARTRNARKEVAR